LLSLLSSLPAILSSPAPLQQKRLKSQRLQSHLALDVPAYPADPDHYPMTRTMTTKMLRLARDRTENGIDMRGIDWIARNIRLHIRLRP
jgi:hypothetical protein